MALGRPRLELRGGERLGRAPRGASGSSTINIVQNLVNNAVVHWLLLLLVTGNLGPHPETLNGNLMPLPNHTGRL